MHYRPRTLVITNIEHDHADIYRDVDAILWQFHQLLRTVPGDGLIAANGADGNIEKLILARRLDRHRDLQRARRRRRLDGRVRGRRGEIHVQRAAAWRAARRGCLVADRHAQSGERARSADRGDARRRATDVALRGLAKFKGVKRRLERLGVFGGITVYEDFAHHPTAIAATLRAVRSQQPQQRIVAVIEPRSNTMRMGTHRESLPLAFEGADKVFVLAARDLSWNPQESLGRTRLEARRGLGSRRPRERAGRRSRPRRQCRADVQRELSRRCRAPCNRRSRAATRALARRKAVESLTLQIPLFPLGTVLFPGGPLQLRIFEPRYLDMISRCLREQTDSASSRSRRDPKSAPPPRSRSARLPRSSIGSRQPDGLLGITVVGRDSFVLKETSRAADGLYSGRVRLRAASEATQFPSEFVPLADLLRKLIPLAAQYRGMDHGVRRRRVGQLSPGRDPAVADAGEAGAARAPRCAGPPQAPARKFERERLGRLTRMLVCEDRARWSSREGRTK